MNTRAEPRVQAAIEDGERLLWSGRPGQALRVRPRHWLLLGYVAVMLALAAYVSVMEIERVWYVVLIPLILLGIGAIVDVFLDRRRRRNTSYGVTDRRVLIVRESPNWTRALLESPYQPEITSIALRDLADMSVGKRVDGSGNITFKRSLRNPPAFEMIDVDRVYGLIEEAKRASAAHGQAGS